jgi:hypothetical protein
MLVRDRQTIKAARVAGTYTRQSRVAAGWRRSTRQRSRNWLSVDPRVRAAVGPEHFLMGGSPEGNGSVPASVGTKAAIGQAGSLTGSRTGVFSGAGAGAGGGAGAGAGV